MSTARFLSLEGMRAPRREVMSLVLNRFLVSHEDIPKLSGRVKPQQAPQADSPLSTARPGGGLLKKQAVILPRGGWSWGKGAC